MHFSSRSRTQIVFILGICAFVTGITFQILIPSDFQSDIDQIERDHVWTAEVSTSTWMPHTSFKLFLFLNLFQLENDTIELHIFELDETEPQPTPEVLIQNYPKVEYSILQVWQNPDQNYSIYRIAASLKPNHRYILTLSNSAAEEFGINYNIAAIR